MSIIKNGRERAIECDECPETTDEFDKDDFAQMVATAKADGWQIEPTGDGYSHRCPDCRVGDRLAAARAKFG